MQSASEHQLTPQYFFDLEKFQHHILLSGLSNIWDALDNISKYIQDNIPISVNKGKVIGSVSIDTDNLISIGQGTVIEHGVMIKGPAIIGKNCQIRSGAYLRGGVITGDRCVIGHSTQVKNCILMNDVQIPHFNYIGDSILGNGTHMGAGVIVSNLRLDRNPIKVEFEGEKLGAIVGDNAEVGCNSVLNPGSVIGRNTVIYPGVQFRGTVPSNKLVKLKQQYTIVDRI